MLLFVFENKVHNPTDIIAEGCSIKTETIESLRKGVKENAPNIKHVYWTFSKAKTDINKE